MPASDSLGDPAQFLPKSEVILQNAKDGVGGGLLALSDRDEDTKCSCRELQGVCRSLGTKCGDNSVGS